MCRSPARAFRTQFLHRRANRAQAVVEFGIVALKQRNVGEYGRAGNGQDLSNFAIVCHPNDGMLRQPNEAEVDNRLENGSLALDQCPLTHFDRAGALRHG